MVLVPPPIQGLGLSGGFQMQVELTDGSDDFVRLQKAADDIVARALADPAIRMALTPLRASVPQLTIHVEKTQAETFGVDVGRRLQHRPDVPRLELRQPVHALRPPVHGLRAGRRAVPPRDAEPRRLLHARERRRRWCRSARSRASSGRRGPSVITLYNLYPSATINGAANEEFSSGQAMQVMEKIAARDAARRA